MQVEAGDCTNDSSMDSVRGKSGVMAVTVCSGCVTVQGRLEEPQAFRLCISPAGGGCEGPVRHAGHGRDLRASPVQGCSAVLWAHEGEQRGTGDERVRGRT